MRLQIKPERWQCLVTSFAMALDLPVADVIREVGHDGGQIIWPTLPEPMCRRGFHPQELIDVCRSHGYAVTCVELFPGATPQIGQVEFRWLTREQAWPRFSRVIRNSKGVIEGTTLPSRKGHAVAYDHGHVFDPNGLDFPYSPAICKRLSFITQHLWCLDKIGGDA
jgi:hypothetical protein